MSALSAGYGLIDEKVAKINTENLQAESHSPQLLSLLISVIYLLHKIFWVQFAAKVIFGAKFTKRIQGLSLPGPNLPEPNLSGPNMPGPICLKNAWGLICQESSKYPSIRLSVSPQKNFPLLFLLLLCCLWTILSAQSSSSPPNLYHSGL